MTKIWLPLLLTALVIALYLESGSVTRFAPKDGWGEPVGRTPYAGDKPQTAGSEALPRPAVVSSRLSLGSRFASLEDLLADQAPAGFVRTGYFGKFWPATVTEIANDRDGISFVRQNGTRHNYTKFDGYRMKMVRLKAGSDETIVVFRSVSKN